MRERMLFLWFSERSGREEEASPSRAWGGRADQKRQGVKHACGTCFVAAEQGLKLRPLIIYAAYSTTLY